MNSAIETTLLNNIKTVLSDFPEYWNEDTLLKNKVIEDLRSYDESVVTALLSNEKIKETYALPVGDMTIFKVDEFIEMLRYKNYWDNSYTKYRNEIGLTTDGKYLNYNTDVVLDFPFKDCVLEGGMSNEDEGKQEVYYHNVIAKEEIDTLLSPKVLTNMKMYDKNGEHEVTEFNNCDNLIIKGNNLLALHTLKEKYSGKVKLVFIDPPYNLGNDSFKYNDKFNHSTWLTFMRNRLDSIKTLLSPSGSLWITLDDNEVHYLKVLCDEIFGRENFLADIIWEKSDSPKMDSSLFSSRNDHILVYSKDSTNVEIKKIKNEKVLSHYNKTDSAGRSYYLKPLRAMGVDGYREKRPALYFPVTAPDGSPVYPKNQDGSDSRWRWSKKRVEERSHLLEWVNGKKGWSLYFRIYADESQGTPPETIWSHKEVGSNRTSKRESKDLLGEYAFSTPKPEGLLSRILDITTVRDDIVLDSFLGSATTAAVSLKKKRKFIGIEQMDYINTVSIPRLQKVIDGEQGGISKDVDWQGGGSFVYAELNSLNQHYIDRLNEITSEEELEAILEELKASAYLNFKVELHKVTVEDEDFSNFSLDKKKKILIDVLDMNQLYLNYSEIDDTQYNISEEIKQFKVKSIILCKIQYIVFVS